MYELSIPGIGSGAAARRNMVYFYEICFWFIYLFIVEVGEKSFRIINVHRSR